MKKLALLIGVSLFLFAGCATETEKEVELTGENYLTYLDSARQFKEKGDVESARKELAKMMELIPEDAEIMDGVAWTLRFPYNRFGQEVDVRCIKGMAVCFTQ